MMLTYAIIAVLFIIFMILLKKFFFKAFKILFILSLVFLLVSAVFGYFLFSEVMGFKDSISGKDNSFILRVDDKLVAGTIFSENKEPRLFGKEELASLERDLKNDNLKNKDTNIIIIDSDAFDDGIVVSFGDINFSKSQTLEIIKAPEPSDKIYSVMQIKSPDSEIISEEKFKEELFDRFSINTSSQIRGLFLALMLASQFQNSGPDFLISALSEENVYLPQYPLISKAISLIPLEEAMSLIKR